MYKVKREFRIGREVFEIGSEYKGEHDKKELMELGLLEEIKSEEKSEDPKEKKKK